MKIAITGVSGFLGSNLATMLSDLGHEIVAIDRKKGQFESQLRDSEVLVHTAALVHSFEDRPYEEYYHSNVLLTKQLAEAAKNQKVKKFIFISTIKVFGEERVEPIDENTTLNPIGHYSKSKAEAEKLLHDIFDHQECSLFILRPPLIFGPKVKANMGALIKLVSTSLPLPLKYDSNRRSFIFIDNFLDIIVKLIQKDIPSNDFVVTDTTLSIYELCYKLKTILGSKTFLFSVPTPILKFLFSCIGQSEKYYRLFGSLHINDNRIRQALDWSPPIEINESLKATIKG
ncbi:MAG: NAD-dependent epimerase/dehydratase family protein [Oligoflexia bacterium]|nr:NAD-dependent epimerase/dehydratase family protein [Oligoflexia bacterium]